LRRIRAGEQPANEESKLFYQRTILSFAALLGALPVAAVPGPLQGGARAGLPRRAAPARSQQRTRRPHNAAYPCANSGNGSGAFVGGGFANVAGGQNSSAIDGDVNDACTNDSAIAGGLNNGIFVDASNPQGGADAAFIGAGHENTSSGFDTALGAGEYNSITTLGAWSFLGAGQYDVVNAPYAAVAAGINNEADGQNSFVGAGQGNIASGSYAVVAGGGDGGGDFTQGQYDGNHATGDNSFIGAGEHNVALGLASAVTAGLSNFATGPYSIASAGEVNFATGTYSFAGAGYSNRASGASAFVGSGGGNTASGSGSVVVGGGAAGAAGAGSLAAGQDAFVGAGSRNEAIAVASVIGGGANNVITPASAGKSTGAAYAVVAGGYRNTVDSLVLGGAEYGVISGGYENVATGTYASVPGGVQNLAAGTGSFAAGSKAQARHNGTFAWSDGTGAHPLTSTANDQFLARASGGFFFYSDAADTSGVKLAPGSGTWASLSDRTMKTGVSALDERAVLAKVVALPVTSWSYRSEDPRIRHAGPMAQDFYAAFGLGEDDRHITSIDEDGIALAAIKGLYEKSARVERAALRRNGELGRQLADTRAQLRDVRQQLAALGAKVAAIESRR
jgi:hypothetical protein